MTSKFYFEFSDSANKAGNVLNYKIFIFHKEKKHTSFEEINFILILRYENIFFQDFLYKGSEWYVREMSNHNIPYK